MGIQKNNTEKAKNNLTRSFSYFLIDFLSFCLSDLEREDISTLKGMVQSMKNVIDSIDTLQSRKLKSPLKSSFLGRSVNIFDDKGGVVVFKIENETQEKLLEQLMDNSQK